MAAGRGVEGRDSRKEGLRVGCGKGWGKSGNEGLLNGVQAQQGGEVWLQQVHHE